MRVLISLIFITNCFFSCFGQSAASVSNFNYLIKQHADSMGKSLLAKDAQKFVEFTFPTVVMKMGGKENMVKVMEKAFNDMEKEKTDFLAVSFGHPSKIIRKGREFQCTLPQIIEMEVPTGRLITHSTLIVISDDQGKKWYFIDTSDKDLKTLKEMLPNLSDELIIPKKPKPILYNN